MNGKIRIRHIYKATELKRFHKLEGKHHHMGKTHSGGDTMRIVFEDEEGEWLALMVWGSACYHLRPRDEYIGWNMALRRARQKLVVNNRRFTILAKPGEHPNLASSVRIDARHNARFFADWVRGEWSVEKCHARRGGTYCEDIRTRRCDENVTDRSHPSHPRASNR